MARSQGQLFRTSDHSNLGKAWERDLVAVHDVYRMRGLADVVKNAEQWIFISEKEYHEKLSLIAQGKYAKGTLSVTDDARKMMRAKSDIDFTGGAETFSVCFDAKETTGERIPIEKLKAHQIQRLMMSHRCGTIAGFMIRFIPAMRVFFAPVTYVRQREDTLLKQRGRRAKPGTASISISDLETHGKEIFVDKATALWDWLPQLV